MFTERMARITSEFTAQILEALRDASREELSTRREQQPRAAAKPRHAKAVRAPKPRHAKAVRAPKAAKAVSVPRAKTPRTPAAHLTSAATTFFAERARKGATADQLTAHFAELGLADQSEAVGEAVLDQLARDGHVRDAGFRRSTGTGHRTMPVYVSAR